MKVFPAPFQVLKFILLIFTYLQLYQPLSGQQTQPSPGVRENTPSVHAFLHCTLVVSPDQIISDGTLIIRDGKVESAGPSASVPKDALIHDCSGKWIFPGFIDPWSDFGMPDAPKKTTDGQSPVYDNPAMGSHSWNQAVKPETRADALLNIDPKKAETLRKAGFTMVNAIPTDGIFRGTSTLVNLSSGNANQVIARSQSSQCISFEKGNSTQQYPSSLMGTIALIRQTFYDAQWYAVASKLTSQPGVEKNISLEALNQSLEKKLPILFEAGDHLSVTRAMKIANEFNLPFVYKTNGEDYKIVNQLTPGVHSLIIPLQFPKAYELKDPAEEREISLQKLDHWVQAPWNGYYLGNTLFAYTTSGLKSTNDILDAIRKVSESGLKMKGTLDALTRKPASILGITEIAGTLDANKWANFIVCSGNIFEFSNAEIIETWVQGKEFSCIATPSSDPRGLFVIAEGDSTATLKLKGKISQPSGKLDFGEGSTGADFSYSGNVITFSFKSKEGIKRFRGILNGDKMEGSGEYPDGSPFQWTAARQNNGWNPSADEEFKIGKETKTPRKPFEYKDLFVNLKPETVLVTNATVWTNTEKGVLKNSDVLIENGKIKSVGTGLKTPEGAAVIDGTGKHVSPGIIDEHSHIAISKGVNEGSHSVSAEVRIGDVINNEDINIYRQLAGGVTCSQLLHGSANPIGGQSALIKLRWTRPAEEMKVEDAPGFIKFALGENVKQSNWGDLNTIRYPQTREGVEQTFKDAFQAAKDYKTAWENYKKQGGEKSALVAARKVLQLDAIVEILEGNRNITCHSYVQSEINMLMKLADEMGFKVNTFTHILEGYKVANEMKARNINASSFSDWWAYKYEVIDAIPYNSAILFEHGVNVCVNSDDAEMGRRLNQEAAKGVLYGGMPEEEALKMVTLNPAKALHLDHRMGSIKAGMDADIVIWNNHPLSVYAVPQQTFVDGVRYFDLARDKGIEQMKEEARRKIIRQMLNSPGEKEKFPSEKKEKEYSCGDGSH